MRKCEYLEYWDNAYLRGEYCGLTGNKCDGPQNCPAYIPSKRWFEKCYDKREQSREFPAGL